MSLIVELKIRVSVVRFHCARMHRCRGGHGWPGATAPGHHFHGAAPHQNDSHGGSPLANLISGTCSALWVGSHHGRPPQGHSWASVHHVIDGLHTVDRGDARLELGRDVLAVKQ